MLAVRSACGASARPGAGPRFRVPFPVPCRRSRRVGPVSYTHLGVYKRQAEGQTKQTEAIIRSMTPEERLKPGIINGSRRKRIALGSGTTVSDVNRMLKGFEQTKKMMKQMGAMQGLSLIHI